MSGGSYDYLYGRVDELADRIESSIDPRSRREREWHGACIDPALVDPRVYSIEKKAWIYGEEALAIIYAADAERKWFAELLRIAARAAHDIEWVDSGDFGPGDEVEAIRAVRMFSQKVTGPSDDKDREKP